MTLQSILDLQSMRGMHEVAALHERVQANFDKLRALGEGAALHARVQADFDKLRAPAIAMGVLARVQASAFRAPAIDYGEVVKTMGRVRHQTN